MNLLHAAPVAGRTSQASAPWPGQAGARAGEPAPADTPINILIVDDEPRNLAVLETVLDDPLYRLVRAGSGEEALLALMADEFALLILDVRMPGMSGFELAQAIKQRKKTARVPIIFLTAYGNEDQQVLEGYGSGAVDYLHKPVNAPVLRSKVAVFADLHRTGRELELANRALLAEVTERRRAEARLSELNETLDQRVIERTYALHASDERLRLATDAVGLGIWSWQPAEDRVVWENEWPYEILGVARGEPPVTAAHFAAEFVHPDDLEAFEQAVAATLHGGKTFNFEGRFRRTDGALRWVEFTGRPATHAGLEGQPMRVLGTARDITERMLAQQSLREGEVRYRTLFNSIDEGFCVLEMLADAADAADAKVDFRFIEVNPAFAAQSGLDNVVGKRLSELIPGIDVLWLEAFASVAVSGEPRRMVNQVSGLADQWFDAFAFRIGGAQSRTIAVLVNNVTQRQRTDEALRERERLLSTVTGAARVGLAVVGPGYVYRYANEAYARLLHLPVGSIAERHVYDVLAPSWAQVKPRLDQAFAGRSVAFEMALPATPEGAAPRHFSAFYEPHVDRHGQPTVVVVVVDISHRKRMEMQLLDADRRKDEFLATLAHELRNPLAPVRNAVQVLHLKGPHTPELKWAREVIERQMQAMTRLIDDLMDVSRINQGKIELRLDRVELLNVLHDAVVTSRPLIDECGHELALALPSQPMLIDADPTRLAQAFMNLLNNAAKYMNRGGRIELSAQPMGNDVVVTVKDAGIGIAADRLASVFEMFSQVEAALSRSRGGLGIGLSLAKRLVEMHGGAIKARSGGLGQGSEFEVRLPLVLERRHAPRIEADPEPAAPGAALRILVADDNEDAAATMAMLLEAWGHTVRVAHDGAAAVQAAAGFEPSVVVLDIGMPTLNGYEACRQIRAQPGGPAMIVIALTGWGQPEDLRLSQQAGFDHHLVKPVDPAALIRLINALVAQSMSTRRP